MASADPPTGLMDIASTLNQDEIPFKLRCAICSKLALNAFRLPCCDQAICESCQASLPDTCPVCAHTPVSPDLCKPNKALRTTLKAFLRTEEKKREKERQTTITPTPLGTIPADGVSAPSETAAGQRGNEIIPAKDAPKGTQPSEAKSHEPLEDTPAEGTVTENDPERDIVESVEPVHQLDQAADQPAVSADVADSAQANGPPANGDAPVNGESASSAPSGFPQHPDPSHVAQNMGPGGFSGMGWNATGNFNAMNPFMANALYNFPNAMGMPMGMDPMAANQGMFGDYGMNMTGMMNMGMNFNGQGMYGSLGWDGSQQNNAMWHGGQDKFNPNAFANGTGPPYGGAFGDSNLSPFPSNPDFQPGYQGPGYGRGGFRGRGHDRGHFKGAGRGGFGGPMPGTNSEFVSYSHPDTTAANGTPGNAEGVSQANEQPSVEPRAGEQVSSGAAEKGMAGVPAADNSNQQLQGIPTIDSSDQSTGHMGPGHGRSGYMNGPTGHGSGFRGPMMPGYQPNVRMAPRGPGVEGAPAAPRAMRQGLPNTSVFRQRGFQGQGRGVGSTGSSMPGSSHGGIAEPTGDDTQAQSPARAPSKSRAGSRSASPSHSQAPRPHSPCLDGADDDRESREERNRGRRANEEDRRSRSASPRSSRRSSRRRHHESEQERDRERDQKGGRRSNRSRRHRSRTRSRCRSPTRNGDGRQTDRLAHIPKETKVNGHSKLSSEIGGLDLASRISSGHRSGKDKGSRREEDRERRRDRDREHGRRNRDRDAEHERDRDRDRERPRERERDGKRSRRDRSVSANASDHSSRAQDRRAKRSRNHKDRDRDRSNGVTSAAVAPEPEKDPHTLEREARNRERLLREQQRREMAKSGRRRDSRQDRVVGGRRINYKYEDELEH